MLRYTYFAYLVFFIFSMEFILCKFYSLYIMALCVCVCVRERERERESCTVGEITLCFNSFIVKLFFSVDSIE
jgi:hypothetical protein